MTTITSTPDPGPDSGPDSGLERSARTEVSVMLDPDGGRVRVLLRNGGRTPSIRAMLTGSDPRTAQVSLVPDGALLLAGDRIEIAVVVGPGAGLVLTEPGGTVAYAMDGATAAWDVTVAVDTGARLSWHGMPFVAAAGSATSRSLRVDLAEDARLLLRETVVLGRHGEAGGLVDTGTSVSLGGLSLLREDLAFGPDALSPGILGDNRVHDQILAVGLAPLPDSGDRLDLAAAGVLYRSLATETHRTGLDAVWREAAQSLTEV